MTQHPIPSTMSRLTWTTAALTAIMALAGCHSTPKTHAQLEEARRIYQDASANPEVLKSAPMELERARKSLYRAETAWKEGEDEVQTNHLAYLAKQEAQVALNIGMQHAADNMVTAAGVERERAISDAKTQEAQAAKADAQAARQSAQVARADAQALEQELQTLQGKQTDRGMVVVLQDVLFDVGKSDLKPGAKSRLDKLSSVLQNHPERKLLVEGYTDSTGSDDFNQRLSEARAEAVKDALTSMGVAADRIEARGLGESKPVASNTNAAGRQQNRRVEVVFSDKQGGFGSQ